MYCPFNICCHGYFISPCLEHISCSSYGLRLGSVEKTSAVTILYCWFSHQWNLYILPKDSLHWLYICLSTNIHKLVLTICPKYISNWNSGSSYIKKLVKHGHILSYFFFAPSFLLVSIVLTVNNTLSACLCCFGVGRINPGPFGTGLASCCSGNFGSSIRMCCSISDSISAA